MQPEPAGAVAPQMRRTNNPPWQVLTLHGPLVPHSASERHSWMLQLLLHDEPLTLAPPPFISRQQNSAGHSAVSSHWKDFVLQVAPPEGMSQVRQAPPLQVSDEEHAAPPPHVQLPEALHASPLPVVQSVHAVPPTPQAASEGVWQLPPAQQPPPQLEGVQPVMQVPPMHV
jgi:hypothetical protein